MFRCDPNLIVPDLCEVVQHRQKIGPCFAQQGLSEHGLFGAIGVERQPIRQKPEDLIRRKTLEVLDRNPNRLESLRGLLAAVLSVNGCLVELLQPSRQVFD